MRPIVAGAAGERLAAQRPDGQHHQAHQEAQTDQRHRAQAIAVSPVRRMQAKAMSGIENLARLSNIPEMTRPWATSATRAGSSGTSGTPSRRPPPRPRAARSTGRCRSGPRSWPPRSAGRGTRSSGSGPTDARFHAATTSSRASCLDRHGLDGVPHRRVVGDLGQHEAERADDHDEPSAGPSSRRTTARGSGELVGSASGTNRARTRARTDSNQRSAPAREPGGAQNRVAASLMEVRDGQHRALVRDPVVPVRCTTPTPSTWRRWSRSPRRPRSGSSRPTCDDVHHRALGRSRRRSLQCTASRASSQAGEDLGPHQRRGQAAPAA